MTAKQAGRTYSDIVRDSVEAERAERIRAAAPAMLEALEGLFEHCAMTHKHWGDGDNTKQANAAEAAARAVIASARGETP